MFLGLASRAGYNIVHLLLGACSSPIFTCGRAGGGGGGGGGVHEGVHNGVQTGRVHVLATPFYAQHGFLKKSPKKG